MGGRLRTRRQSARLKNSSTQLKRSIFSQTTPASFKTRFSARSLASLAIRTGGGVKSASFKLWTLLRTSLKAIFSRAKT